MKFKLIFILILKISIVICEYPGEVEENENSQQETLIRLQNDYQVPSKNECAYRLYRGCNYPTHFTDEELENVRQFLNYSFTVLADIKPDKPLCHKLHVRHDWKCLSQQQKERLIKVWKVMYEKGIIQSLTDLHVSTWPSWHKSCEFLPSHRWFSNEFEKYMRTIDPRVTLPYWNAPLYGSQPERSSIWDTLGHSGNYSTAYNLYDGIYSKWRMVPAMKRHWSPRGAIYPWHTPEFQTFAIQSARNYAELTVNVLGLHFQPHINVGGYEGQYSVETAPYDVLFYMHHTSDTDNLIFRWQLLKKEFLTPLSFNQIIPGWNPWTGVLERPDIFTKKLTGVPNFRVKEAFWMGFGDFCFIPDQLVRPINNLWTGIRDPKPTAAKRLPKKIIEKYFPYFISGNFSTLSHTFEEVGECNTECRPLPKPTFLIETDTGRRQINDYVRINGQELGTVLNQEEQKYYKMWLDLNRAGYCSPYATTY